MYYLSRKDLENIAEAIIGEYKNIYVPSRYLCYKVDPTELATLFGYSIENVSLSLDGSVLGQTSSGEIWTTIYEDDGNELFFFLDGKTILVEKKLLSAPNCIGRRNFTIAHELAHQFINKAYPNYYGLKRRTFCDYRRSIARPQINDWYEWQADALAAALLLPREVIEDCMFMFGLGEKMTILSKRFSPNKYYTFCQMADFLQVSKTALSFRMEQLGYLERNRLIDEAQEWKGVAKYGSRK